MGMFTYVTADSGKTLVLRQYHEKLNCPTITRATLLLPCGEKVTGHYDGYGRIDGVDIFAAVMATSLEEARNDDDTLREKFFAYFKKNSLKIKIVENSDLEYDDVSFSVSCDSQGFIPFDDFKEKSIELLEAYKAAWPEDSIKDVTVKTGISSARVFNLFNGAEMTAYEAACFESALEE
jgi:hypothetical protein